MNPDRRHWSETVEWRDGRWDPMSNAPTTGPMVHVRGRTKDGTVVEPMHYACGGGEEQPPFRGWFVPNGPNCFTEVLPVEWQPLRAVPLDPKAGKLCICGNDLTTGPVCDECLKSMAAKGFFYHSRRGWYRK